MKYLDQANLANAYVSGMKEDLKILGNGKLAVLTEVDASNK